MVRGAEMQRNWSGVGTALVTPFDVSGELDEVAFRRLVERQVDGGVQFLVPCGTTGETPTLTSDERDRVVSMTVDVAQGRVPVLAGVGGYNTEEVAELAAHTESLGVQGLLSVTPYYNKPTQEGLVQHYTAIANRTSLPIIVYNVPGRTGCNVEPKTLARLAQIPNIVGVKEASGNMAQMCEVCRVVPSGFSVLCGDDALALPLMAVGGRGVISVASNVVPDRMAKMVTAALDGDFAAARAEHTALLEFMNVNFIESNPIPVKAALAMLGLCQEVYRLPMVPPSAASRDRIRQVLESLGILNLVAH
jgi:4-hydroxy-tetrahydrodipicolinate synthase